jgi:hypothetical protein
MTREQAKALIIKAKALTNTPNTQEPILASTTTTETSKELTTEEQVPK